METSTTITFAFIFSIISTAGLIINLILTIRRDNKTNQREDNTIKEGIIKANMKLDQVCATTLDINKQVDKINDKVNDMALKQENHETRIKMLEGRNAKD